MIGKAFDTKLLVDIEASLQRRVKQNTPLFAAFDADGTLWDTDGGENFFQYQVENQVCDLPNNPMNYYKELKKLNADPRTAYMWLAQICSGYPIQVVRAWADQALSRYSSVPIFRGSFELIDLLHKYHVNIFVITASTTWAIEPMAALLKIPRKNVLGFETEIADSIVTLNPIFRSPYKEGKATAFLAASKGAKPFLCAGNTLGDLELINLSEEFRIVIHGANPQSELGQKELELVTHAQKKNWSIFEPKK